MWPTYPYVSGMTLPDGCSFNICLPGNFEYKVFTVFPENTPLSLSSIFLDEWTSLEFLLKASFSTRKFFTVDRPTTFLYGVYVNKHVDYASKSYASAENSVVGCGFGTSFVIKLPADEVKQRNFIHNEFRQFLTEISYSRQGIVSDDIFDEHVKYKIRFFFWSVTEHGCDLMLDWQKDDNLISRAAFIRWEPVVVQYRTLLDSGSSKKASVQHIHDFCRALFGRGRSRHIYEPRTWKFEVIVKAVSDFCLKEPSVNDLFRLENALQEFHYVFLCYGTQRLWIERFLSVVRSLRDILGGADGKSTSTQCHNSILNTFDEWFPTADDGRNVLLIGPSGAGKSTLINSMVNYFKYDKLTDAAGQELSSVLPCKFAVQDDDYGFHTVALGQDENECFNELGQSVTQVPQLHRLEYGDLTLNLIDTPGLCDSRGVEQDEANVAAICEAIRRAGKLHAICFVMLPNESKMSAGLEYVLTKLLSIFSPKVFPNVCFFFTNSCGTFFKPGDSVQPIKKLMQLTKKQHYSCFEFCKENVFCVDSDAFRYLVVKKHNPKLAYGKFEDFEHNWNMSRKAVLNFLKFVASRKLCTDFFSTKTGVREPNFAARSGYGSSNYYQR